MAAQLRLSRADVTIDGATHADVQVHVNGTGIRVVRTAGDRGHVATRPDVVSVTKPEPRTGRWVVTFGDGTVWHVKRSARPCGCG